MATYAGGSDPATGGNEPATGGPGGLDRLGAVVEWVDDWTAPGPANAEQASEASGVSAAEEPEGPLAGMTVGVKDLIAVAGVPRRCGAADLVESSPQPAHASVVHRLIAAGARPLATCALHQLGFGVISPQTRNPCAPARIAGGSSGGSAAAVAAGLVHAGLGTDTGGSVRIPAACCGLVGIKPTRGLVALNGVAPLAPSLDTVGPLAATVAGAAAVLAVLTGSEPHGSDWAAGSPVSGASHGGSAAAPGRGEVAGITHGLRVGVPAELEQAPMDREVAAAWREALGRLRAQGADVSTVSVPELAEAPSAAGRVLAAEAAEVHQSLAGEPVDALGGDGLWPDVAARLAHGRSLDPDMVVQARRIGDWLVQRLERVWAEVDVLVTPTLPCHAPPAGIDPGAELTVGEGVEPVTLALTRFTNPWNLAGVPAGSVPAGADRDGAPIGGQVVGPWHGERLVVAVMSAIEHDRSGG
jgi:aspartyl-tRNA(Asn)/glutamyl-tRNA(Gln) amidotransferase subunit A